MTDAVRPGEVVPGRLETEPRELFHDVHAGRPAAPAARLAALEGVVGQGVHVPLGVAGGDARAGGGQIGGGCRIGEPVGGGREREDRGEPAPTRPEEP